MTFPGWRNLVLSGVLAAAVGCGGTKRLAGTDAGTQGQPDTATGGDATDAGDTGTDAGSDAGAPAPDAAATDAGADAYVFVDAEPIPVPEGPTGWATQYPDADGGVQVVSGGTGAPATNIYTVHSRLELLAALANTASPTYATDTLAAKKEPKIIYVVGTIRGNDLGNGVLADATTYKTTPTPNDYDFDTYLKYFDTAYKADLQTRADAGDTAAADQLALVNRQPGTSRTSFSNNQKAQIQFQVPPNTTILGVGADAQLVDGYFSINTYSASFGQTVNSNIIIRNLEFQVAQDLAPAWDPTDTSTGNWNARYDGISVVTGRNIWIDHCTFSDGVHLDSLEPAPFNGKHVQRHDGLIDIEDGSDYITVSYDVFRLHDKTTLIGSTGGGTMGQENYETGRERITFSANMWETSTQRAPLGRWGHFHLYDNLYRGNTADPQYLLQYFIGMGTSSSILSEANVFDVTGPGTVAVLQGHALSASGGAGFHDVGSWWGDAPFTNLDALATQKLPAVTHALGWTPPYPYTVGASAPSVRQHVLINAGAGKLDIRAP